MLFPSEFSIHEAIMKCYLHKNMMLFVAPSARQQHLFRFGKTGAWQHLDLYKSMHHDMSNHRPIGIQF